MRRVAGAVASTHIGGVLGGDDACPRLATTVTHCLPAASGTVTFLLGAGLTWPTTASLARTT